MNWLKQYLVENHGLSNDASDSDVQAKAEELIGAKQLSLVQYNDLMAKNAPDPLKGLGEMVSTAVDAAMEKRAKEPAQIDAAALDKAAETVVAKALAQMPAPKPVVAIPDSEVQPKEIITAGAAARAGSQIIPVSAGDRYDATKRAVIYSDTTRYGGKHPLGDRPIMLDTGRILEYPSERQRARAGATLKVHFARQLKLANLIGKHDEDLFRECLAEEEWGGDLATAENPAPYYVNGRRLTDVEQKTVFGGAGDASGGQNLVPQVLELDIVRNSLLNGELAPFVDNRTVTKGTSVDTPTMVNLTISSGTTEATAIVAQSTASLLSKLNSIFFAAVGALKIGRDFLADITPNFMGEVADSYSEQLRTWLDNQIANGDGTTEPLGLFNSSGTNIVTQQSPSPTGWDIKDVERILFSIGKQYRANKGPSVRFVMNDTSYRRIRQLGVSSTDQRRLFGMTHEDYRLLERPVSIQNDISNADVAFVDLSKYRLWRRMGMEMRTSDVGETLMLQNAILIVVRARYAGRLVIGESMAEFNTAPQLE